MHSRLFIGAAPARQTRLRSGLRRFPKQTTPSRKIPRVPDPRTAHKAVPSGTGLTVKRPWGNLSRPSQAPSPERWWGPTQQWTASTASGPSYSWGADAVAAATCDGDVEDASVAAHASVGQLDGPPGCSPGFSRTCRFESCPAHLALAGQWSVRLVVSEEIAGSSPVGSAHEPMPPE